jgi:hypothetical protein
MLIIHGVYRWWPKRVAFRNDYCLACEAPRRAIATRTFDVGHIFWIPLVPVGFWKHWSCTQCHRNPHAPTKTRRAFKWIGLVCLILLAMMFWFTDINPELRILSWLLRLLPTGGAIVLLIQLLVTPAEPSLRERLAEIQPATDTICPFCETPLVTAMGTQWSCPACGVVRY